MDNDTMNMLFTSFGVPLLTVLVGFIIAFVQKKTELLNTTIKKSNLSIGDIELTKYTKLAENAIIRALKATNITYVNSLKSSGSFGAEAQLEAFEKTKEVALNIMDETTKEFMDNAIIDFQQWINTMIENLVEENKLIK